MAEKGEVPRAPARFLEERVDPLQIEREARIPDDVVDGLKQLGALGMKIPRSTAGSASRRSTTTARWR